MVLYTPHSQLYFLFFTAILGVTLSLLFLGAVGLAFRTLFPGLSYFGILILLVGCLAGSYVNLPVTMIKAERPVVRVRHIKVFGIVYHVPSIAMEMNRTLLAINLGGAVIPSAASIYLLWRLPDALFDAVLATLFVAVLVKGFSKPVVGVGIVSPSFISPLVAALAAILLGGEYAHVVAYVAGTLGTLIGADLLNFRWFSRLGSPIVSIGGAGTFDGIFLSGIVATLIAV